MDLVVGKAAGTSTAVEGTGKEEEEAGTARGKKDGAITAVGRGAGTGANPGAGTTTGAGTRAGMAAAAMEKATAAVGKAIVLAKETAAVEKETVAVGKEVCRGMMGPAGAAKATGKATDEGCGTARVAARETSARGTAAKVR